MWRVSLFRIAIASALLLFICSLRAQPGSLDLTFDPGSGVDGSVMSIVRRDDGSLYIGGGFTGVNGTNRQYVALMNTNGSLDLGFNPAQAVPGPVNAMALDASNRVLAAYWQLNFGVTYGFMRLNPNGTADLSFSNNVSWQVRAIAVLPTGQILIGGQFNRTYGALARLNENGSLDPSFAVTLNGAVEAITFDHDGKLLIGGSFLTVNGTVAQRVARLETNGVVDTSFDTATAGPDNLVQRICVQPDGKILITGWIANVAGVPRQGVARLNTNGTLDTTFNVQFDLGPWSLYTSSVLADGSGKIYLGGNFRSIDGSLRGGVARLHPNGRLDTGFDPGFGLDEVNTLLLQPDGRIVVGGDDFYEVNGVSRRRLARLNGGEVPPTPPSILIQPTNQTVIAGGVVTFLAHAAGSPTLDYYQWQFNGTNLDGATRATLTLSNVLPANAGSYTLLVSNQLGTATTAPALLTVTTFPPIITLQPTNLTLRAGQDAVFRTAFTAAPPATVQWYVDASTDPREIPGATNATLTIPNVRTSDAGEYKYIAVVSNAVGSYETDFVSLTVLPALTNAGRVDIDFRVTEAWLGHVRSIVVQPDGKLVVGGARTFISNQLTDPLVRLNPDGSIDPTFTLPLFVHTGSLGSMGAVEALLLEPDGGILVGLVDLNVAGMPQRVIVRLHPNGSLNTNFVVAPSFQRIVALGRQSDGRIIVAQDLQPNIAPELFRLNTDGSRDPSFTATNAVSGPQTSLSVQADEKIVFATAFGLQRLLPNGSPDLTFNPASLTMLVRQPYRAMSDPQEKVWVFGASVPGPALRTNRLGLVRLHATGAHDPTFQATLCDTNAHIRAVVIQPNGKLVIGGSFTNIQGTARRGIARLNRDGTLDPSFDPGTGIPGATIDGGVLALTSEGKVLAGGGLFVSVDGYPRTNLVQLYGDPPSAPFIVTHPISQVVTAGQTVVFAAEVSGIPLPAYQWQFNGTNIVGESNAVFRLFNALADVAGSYRVVVSNQFGTAVSDPATLTVNSEPTVPGSLDSAFNTSFGANAPVRAMVAQPDGKLVIGGLFTAVQSISRNRIARVNADGSLDNSFVVGSGAIGSTNPAVYALIRQPDGKLLVGGSFTNFNGAAHTNLVRLNENGVIDASFTAHLSLADSNVFTIALQPDGKILAGHSGPYGLTRLHSDGTIDTNFARITGQYGRGSVYAIALFPDGTIVAGGDFPYYPASVPYLTRVQTNGIRASSSSVNGPVRALHAYPDGRLLVGGDFNYMGGAGMGPLGRLDAQGFWDWTFYTGITGAVHTVALDECGRLIVGGQFTHGSRRCIARLHPDGAIDNSFADPRLDGAVFALAQQEGELFLGGEFVSANRAMRQCLARLHVEAHSAPSFLTQPTSRAVVAGQDIMLQATVLCPPVPHFQWFRDGQLVAGATNPGLVFRNIQSTNGGGYSVVISNSLGAITSTVANLTVARATNRPGAADINFYPPTNFFALFSSDVYSLAVERDGKLLAGFYSTEPVRRFNTDGSLAGSFSWNIATGVIPFALAVQDDGGILVGNSSFFHLVRLFPDGRRDTNYAASVNDDVKAIRLLPDGRALIAGHFGLVNGESRSRIARLREDGTLDDVFAPENTAGDIEALALQPDGRILIGGRFTRIGATNRSSVARLHANGQLDLSFDAEPGISSSMPGSVLALAVQSDGKILVGGEFTQFQGAANRFAIVRLHPDGRLDTTFNPPATWYHIVYALASLPDNSVIMGGTGGAGSPPFLRWLSDGQRDWSFATGNNVERRANDQPQVARVRAMALHTTGRIYIGGSFTHYNGFVRSSIARIHGWPEPDSIAYANDVTTMNLLTDPDRSYDLQFTDSLLNTTWTNLTTISGDGAEHQLKHTNSAGGGFYRIRASSHP